MKKNKNNVLVALMNSRSDFEIAQTKLWYRIPVKSAPPIVRNNELKLIAFYQTKVFGKEKYCVKWYAPVRNISVCKRKDLFPEIKDEAKSENDYYKISFGALCELPNPIKSKRGRFVIFIPTTEVKFFAASEVNDLFSDSILEDIIWKKFKENNITAERQFYIAIENFRFALDFAVFCKTRNIDIECDGDTFHNNYENIKKDKKRNNILESAGWSVLRFSTDDLLLNFTNTYRLITNTINKYGGIQDIKDFSNYKYLPREDDNQLSLFD